MVVECFVVGGEVFGFVEFVVLEVVVEYDEVFVFELFFDLS